VPLIFKISGNCVSEDTLALNPSDQGTFAHPSERTGVWKAVSPANGNVPNPVPSAVRSPAA
jgi:hypothetical protein